MGAFFSKFKVFGIVLLVISAIIITLFYNALKPEVKLPIYQPADFNTELVDSTLLHKKKYHTVANFKLTNQNGKTITQDNYANKIYVADFFFTTCQTICPVMTKNMVKVQEIIKNDDDVMLLSHSVTPEIDSVAQLKKYALKKGVIDSKWNLVTGDRKEIYDLARKSYMAAKTDLNNPYSMVHTENFVLVDKEKRIRGTYDGTDSKEIEKLIEDIKILKASYKD
ncbi:MULTISPECIES: SCO family protein [Cellulophaga]|uniref:Electron transport protein SCO1/SenC n=2 Tax=Cellulophaga TaxID=104264 RepID=F0RAB5_CELLC|nr:MULTISPECIES: SCO family protein [Cellulophaga]ADY29459.1 electron transport protein SCO1/SenC [Cellulophaga lytica DSM 7489]APU10343.1 photosynthetic protein synthase II [Cellulophaga lytica]EWH13834.1 electron transport protein SCO1/SenC [Cellulophaga geojensis KL-A]MDO6852247.1 SCO family protein [Cellulophaga lytica]TVZ07995.1 protein SCO1/2 [Cellulophaga sp. RHA_52]